MLGTLFKHMGGVLNSNSCCCNTAPAIQETLISPGRIRFPSAAESPFSSNIVVSDSKPDSSPEPQLTQVNHEEMTSSQKDSFPIPLGLPWSSTLSESQRRPQRQPHPEPHIVPEVSELFDVSEDISSRRTSPDAAREWQDQELKGGVKYTGEWLGEVRDGHGVQTWPDGTKYEGQWKENIMNGIGCLSHPNGDVYTGNFEFGKACGHGSLKKVDGFWYEGQWVDGKQHGEGKETSSSGARYEGAYKFGCKSGAGLLTLQDGDTFNGQFVDDAFHGEGKYIWKDNCTYQGQWSFSQIQGRGRFDWDDGSFYLGEYEKSLRDGRGVYKFANGASHDGLWKAGLPHGNAIKKTKRNVDVRTGTQMHRMQTPGVQPSKGMQRGVTPSSKWLMKQNEIDEYSHVLMGTDSDNEVCDEYDDDDGIRLGAKIVAGRGKVATRVLEIEANSKLWGN